jgi:hypothetical protein
MDENSLRKHLRHILKKVTDSNFYVISRNCLKSVCFTAKKTFIIVNTSNSYPGKHWVAFYVLKTQRGNIVEYFDSFCKPPSFYRIQFPLVITRRNRRGVQGRSATTCGLHCLFFLYHKARNAKLSEIESMYSANTLFNDRFVNCFFQKI